LLLGGQADPPVGHLIVEHPEIDASDERLQASLGVASGGRHALFGFCHRRGDGSQRSLPPQVSAEEK
jgi:hypothetical protein